MFCARGARCHPSDTKHRDPFPDRGVPIVAGHARCRSWIGQFSLPRRSQVLVRHQHQEFCSLAVQVQTVGYFTSAKSFLLSVQSSYLVVGAVCSTDGPANAEGGRGAVIVAGGADVVEDRLDGSAFLRTVFILDSSLRPTPLALSSLAAAADSSALEVMATRCMMSSV